MFDGRWRSPIEQGLEPIGRGLRRTGISADVVTATGVVMATATAFAIGNGQFRLSVLLLALTGVPDALDGAVAKASGTQSTRGAFLDSVTDRLTDGILFGGLAWYYAGQSNPRLAMLPFALLVAASLVSYQRAKAESLGFDARGGLMERAERFFVLGFGLLFSELLLPVLWIMLGLTVFTALQRFVKVWRQADRPPAPARPARNPRRRPARSRRRTLRQDSESRRRR